MGSAERDPADETWGITPGMPVWIGGMGLGGRAAVERGLGGVRRVSTGSIERLIVTPRTADEALYFVQKHAERLSDDGTLWIVCRSDETAEAEHGEGIIGPVTLALQRDGWAPLCSAVLDGGFSRHGFRRVLYAPGRTARADES